MSLSCSFTQLFFLLVAGTDLQTAILQISEIGKERSKLFSILNKQANKQKSTKPQPVFSYIKLF